MLFLLCFVTGQFIGKFSVPLFGQKIRRFERPEPSSRLRTDRLRCHQVGLYFRQPALNLRRGRPPEQMRTDSTSYQRTIRTESAEERTPKLSAKVTTNNKAAVVNGTTIMTPNGQSSYSRPTPRNFSKKR